MWTTYRSRDKWRHSTATHKAWNLTVHKPNPAYFLRQPLKSAIRRGAFDSAKNHKRQRRKRQSVTAKREKSQTPKFV